MRRAHDGRVRWPLHRSARSASVRLPLITTFPQAPLRSRKAGFPRSGSDLGFPSWAFPDTRRSSSTDIHTPRLRWFTHDLVPASKAGLSRLKVRGPPWDRQVPRAPSLQAGVTGMQKTSRVSSQNITSTSSLLRAHAPDRCPPVALGNASGSRSLQVAVSPCCATALPDAISADLSVRVWTPTPVAPRAHFPVSSPEALAFPEYGPGRRITKAPTATSVGRSISELQSFTHVQTRTFARHTGSSHPLTLRCRAAVAFSIRAYHGSLPPRAADTLTAQTG
jgi:hypothetical protein